MVPARVSASFLACFLLLAAPHASAAGVLLDELTWTEVRDAVRGGATTIIIPIGGTEQNGPHMALGKHNVRAAVLAGRIASALGNALVAPVVAYVPEGAVSPPTGHMRFAGTISVPDEAFVGVLAGAARSLRQHGFRDIVLIGDSGDYQPLLRQLSLKLNKEWAGGSARAHHIVAYYQAATTGFRDLLQSRGIAGPEVAAHAGVADTALMLGIDPSKVRPQHPPLATAALGQAGADLMVEKTVAAIRQAIAARN